MDIEEKTSPVYHVKAVPVEKVCANNYNPNVVAPPEMKLLELSIWEDGFTMVQWQVQRDGVLQSASNP